MNRHTIISEALMKPPHPRYQPLTYTRFLRISKLKGLIPDEDPQSGAIGNAISWVICTRDFHDPEVETAMASEDPIAAFEAIWSESLHVSEIVEFKEWFDAEFVSARAAQTVAKPDSKAKKHIGSEEPNPTT